MKDLYKEYLEFMNEGAEPAEKGLAYETILGKLDPKPIKVFFVFLAVTIASSFLTLIVCPQFGLGGLLFGHEIIHFAAAGGDILCGAFCASIFFGFSLLVSQFVLTPAYKRKVYAYNKYFALGVPAAAMFFLMTSSAFFGEFVFMGLLFSVSWFGTSVAFHYLTAKLWRSYATT